jgi:hypothetical protein
MGVPLPSLVDCSLWFPHFTTAGRLAAFVELAVVSDLIQWQHADPRISIYAYFNFLSAASKQKGWVSVIVHAVLSSRPRLPGLMSTPGSTCELLVSSPARPLPHVMYQVQDDYAGHRGELTLTFTEAANLLGTRAEVGGRVRNVCPASFAAEERHPVHRDGHAKAVQFQRGAASGSAYPEPHAIGEAFTPHSRVKPAFDAINSLLPVSWRRPHERCQRLPHERSPTACPHAWQLRSATARRRTGCAGGSA